MAYPMLSKESVRYRGDGGREHCSLCRHFESSRGGRCKRVLGQISPRGWCRLFSQEARGLIADVGQAAIGGGPSLGLDFMQPGVLDPRITFTRASTATYFDSAGVMQNAATNAPRWDYDPATLALRGLLIEEARTNGIPNGNAVGAVVGGTLPTGWAESNNTGIAPAVTGFGTESGIPYVDIRFAGTTSSGTANNIYIANGTVPAGNSQAWTASVYLRLTAGTMPANSVSVLAASNIGPHYPPTVTPTGAPLVSQRYLNAFTTAASGVTSLSLIIGISMPPLTAVDFTLRIGAAQLEAGAFPTSYIATAGSAQTRAQDYMSIPTAGWYSTTQGSVVAKVGGLSWNGSGTFNNGIFTFDDNASNRVNAIDLMGFTNNGTYIQPNIAVAVGGVNQGGMGYANLNVGNAPLIAVAAAWGAGRVALSANGGAVQTSGLTGLPTVNRLVLGWGFGGIGPLQGYLRSVAYYPRALADHELIAVTYNPGATLLPAPEPPVIDNELPTPPPARPDNELPETPTPRGRRNGR